MASIEIFAATVRLALESNHRWVVVKVDFRNAFNEVSRLAFLRFCAAHFPQLLLFLLAAYGAPAYITALGPDGWVRFLSRCGCTQGCPLGPLAFAAALQLVLERVRDRCSDCLVVSLHDDAQIAGPIGRVREALAELIEAAAGQCGLVPTGHKFVLYVPWLDTPLSVLEQGQLEHCHRDLDTYTPVMLTGLLGATVGRRRRVWWLLVFLLAVTASCATLLTSVLTRTCWLTSVFVFCDACSRRT